MIAGVDHLGVFIAAGLLLNLTPGPDVLFIVSQGLRSGARAGVVAALGITAGCLVHVVAATVGIGALVAASATAFTVLKWLGAAYLLYTGVRLLLSRQVPMDLNAANGQPVGLGAQGNPRLRQVFARAFLTNALNPKVALFFLAFLPQFIAPGRPDASWSFLALGLLFTFNSAWVNIGYGLVAAWLAGLAGRMAALARSMVWLDRLAGVLFVGFGLRLALSER